jgi:hypothetical protein
MHTAMTARAAVPWVLVLSLFLAGPTVEAEITFRDNNSYFHASGLCGPDCSPSISPIGDEAKPTDLTFKAWANPKSASAYSQVKLNGYLFMDVTRQPSTSTSGLYVKIDISASAHTYARREPGMLVYTAGGTVTLAGNITLELSTAACYTAYGYAYRKSQNSGGTTDVGLSTSRVTFAPVFTADGSFFMHGELLPGTYMINADAQQSHTLVGDASHTEAQGSSVIQLLLEVSEDRAACREWGINITD